MKKEEIQAWDWNRIMFGQAPPEFLIEVLFRTIIVYLLLLVILRLLGKRMDGQLTLTEMAVMITLGAIISVPAQMPERGILLGGIALLFVLAFQRGVNWLQVKNEKIEDISQGTMSILVKDGLLQLDEMQKAGISKQDLFAALRAREVFNLGKVKRLYFEACGVFSLYQQERIRPGLPVYPSGELEFVKDQTTVDAKTVACANCGNVSDASDKNISCRNCGEKKWTEAII
jgi:uncharacterized membrane protein YcaP (DUF421 family)